MSKRQLKAALVVNDNQLERTLRSIGKACFVNYFTEFSDPSLSDEAVARILVEREGWDDAATLHFRVRGARRIIEADRDKDALMSIANSPRMRKLESRVRSLLRHGLHKQTEPHRRAG